MTSFDIENILTILDKPKYPQLALERTLELQAQTNAQARLLAFCWNSVVDSSSVLEPTEQLQVQKQILDTRSQWHVENVPDDVRENADVSFQTVWAKDIAPWVTKHLQEQPTDLLVKAVHRTKNQDYSPLEWELLRTCPAPVLLVNSAQHAQHGCVMAALDLRHNDESHRALNDRVLEAACRMAHLRGTTLHCVYSLGISKVLRDLDVLDVTKAKRRLLKSAQTEINDLISNYSIEKEHLHFPVGKVAKTVPQMARTHKASLLVVGSHAHRARQMVGLGNSAQQIMTNTKCDLLVVHP